MVISDDLKHKQHNFSINIIRQKCLVKKLGKSTVLNFTNFGQQLCSS